MLFVLHLFYTTKFWAEELKELERKQVHILESLAVVFVFVIVVAGFFIIVVVVYWFGGFIYLFIYCSYSLEPVGYGRYRKGISINKSSKTDIRKQARKPDKENPPPGRRLPQSIRAQLYKN